MATNIPEVADSRVSHAIIIDLTLDDTTYYISSAYKPITYLGNNYTELGSFLNLGEITNDLKTTNGDVAISLSGIPQDKMNIILDPNVHIKGGEVIVRRVFFNYNTMAVSDVYERYRGIITNWAIEEAVNYLTGDLAQTITISCASINALLENRITGQRTNGTSRKKLYPGDISFDRVKDLQNTNFDFGREFSYGNGYGGPGFPGMPGFPGWRPGDFNFNIR